MRVRTVARDLTEEDLRRFLDAFYGKVRRDASIGPVFATVIADEAWPAHLAKIYDFWSSVMLRTGCYKGNPFAAHIGKALRPEHFARWLALFDETAVERFDHSVAREISGKAHAIGQSLKAGLFFRSQGAATISRAGDASDAP